MHLSHQLDHFLDAQGAQVNTHILGAIQADIRIDTAQHLDYGLLGGAQVDQ